jgi:hypothetical protein
VNGMIRNSEEQTKSPAENRGALFEIRKEDEEEVRSWQAWQRPTLPSLEA